MTCPACRGEGLLGWVGTASTCVFCSGAKSVTSAEAGRYDDRIERLLERHADDGPMVTLSLTDDVSLRASNGSRWQLRIPLPPLER